MVLVLMGVGTGRVAGVGGGHFGGFVDWEGYGMGWDWGEGGRMEIGERELWWKMWSGRYQENIVRAVLHKELVSS